MPFGAPSQTVPKSGCRPVLRPMLAINAAEFGSTGAPEISWFQGLSGGKTCWPSMKAPGPGVPAGSVDRDARPLDVPDSGSGGGAVGTAGVTDGGAGGGPGGGFGGPGGGGNGGGVGLGGGGRGGGG